MPTVIVQSFRVGPFAQISDRDDIKCGGEHADLAIHCVPAEPGGWRIQPASVSYQIINEEGQWYPCGPDHSGLANACYSFSTIHHVFGTSGKILFYLTYTAEKEALVNHTETTSVPISWEEIKVFKLPEGATWTGTFNRFDGKQFSFSGPYEDSYLKIGQDNIILNIKVKP